MKTDDRIYIAGHTGLVGSALVRALRKAGFSNLLLKERSELDLTATEAVAAFLAAAKPDCLFMAAAMVGGIGANSTRPAEFIFSNLSIQNNLIDQAWKNGVKKLLFLGSSCIYPRECPQPIREEYLLTGPLETTNEAYAVAKIAGIKMCQAYHHQYGANFISVMPTNLYGPGDHYDLEGSHVLPALLRKFHTALPDRPVTLWGSGSPRREFLHVDDLAEACLFLMQNYDHPAIVNIGTGEDLTIRELAGMVQQITGHRGPVIWDDSKPDGTLRKRLDVSKIHALGWRHRIGLSEGIHSVYTGVDKSSW
jgi:GDP-L-fucose synthase